MKMTLEELNAEIEEKGRDLQVFYKAREMIRARVLEIVDSKSSLTPLPQWSGTDAVLGTLDLVVHSIERTLNELREWRSKLEGTYIPYTVKDDIKN